LKKQLSFKVRIMREFIGKTLANIADFGTSTLPAVLAINWP
jgi:hypothetical protein